MVTSTIINPILFVLGVGNFVAAAYAFKTQGWKMGIIWIAYGIATTLLSTMRG